MPHRIDFLLQAGLDALTQYIEQAEAHEANPANIPAPDPALLRRDQTHGPICTVSTVEIEGEAQVAVSIHSRPLRYFDPSDYAALALSLAFGGGLSLNDTGGGLAYPRTRTTKPKGRAIHLLRVLMNAQPWQVAEQRMLEGERVDYHWLSRRFLSLRSVRIVWKEGKPSRVPRIGREAFLDAAAQRWTANHQAAGLSITLDAYLDLIRRALALGDRHYARLAAVKKSDQ